VEARRPSADVHVGPTARLGIYIEQPSAYGFGFYKGTKGALVVGIAPHSPAAATGLSAGDVITSFAGKQIRSPTDFDSVLLSRAPKERVELAWVDEFGRTESAKVVLTSGPPQ
jgi:S1-C subfamily serine protease